MRSELSPRGCLNATIGLFLLLFLCFVAGVAFQVGWLTLTRSTTAIAPTPLPTVPPAPSAPPTETATPTATLAPSATPTLPPTDTPEPRPTLATRAPVTRSPTATVAAQSYTVQEGDTFFSVARQFDLTPEELTAANPDVDPDVLNVGDRLVIPTP